MKINPVLSQSNFRVRGNRIPLLPSQQNMTYLTSMIVASRALKEVMLLSILAIYYVLNLTQLSTELLTILNPR